jgi:hypothetical protein
MTASALLEPLPYDAWQPTKITLQLWCQIVGKFALRSTALRNHWWNATLRPTARGVATGRLRAGDTFFDIELDLVDHRAVVRASNAHAPATFALHDGLSVAVFYASMRAALATFGIDVPIVAKPYGIPGESTRFADDRDHHAYDAAAVGRWWKIVLWSSDVFERFASEFAGKQSPVQLFWHSFDLALGRYSGRRSDRAASANPVEREAYSHEVIAFGFWPGDPNVPAPTYYTYTAPEPPDLMSVALRPEGAAWNPSGSGHIGALAYETVRTADDPEAALTAFLRSGYEAGTQTARWDTAVLEHRG